MKVGDLVTGTTKIQKKYGQFSSPQLFEPNIGKIYNIGGTRDCRYLVKWKVNGKEYSNGYDLEDLRVISFNKYLTQIEEC